MLLSAMSVMEEFTEIFMSYGQSDEFSFVFERNAEVFNRRSEKILSCVVSRFSAAYTFYWNTIFPSVQLKFPPCFDGRTILYPSYTNLRDYFSWRQADCHINNLYNTCFWALVNSGNYNKQQANQLLKPTFSADKHEILFKQFNINYNNIPSVFRKGTTIFRKIEIKTSKTKMKQANKNKSIDSDNKENNSLKEEIKTLNNLETKLEIIEEKKCEKEENVCEKKTQLIVEEEDSKLVSNHDNILFDHKNFFEIYQKFINNLFVTNDDIIRPDFWSKNNFKDTNI